MAKPTYDELEAIAKAAVRFHRSLMSDWAAPRPERPSTQKQSDQLEAAYLPFAAELTTDNSGETPSC